MFEEHRVCGVWSSGPHLSKRGTLVDFRSGLAVVMCEAAETMGRPEAFTADSGETGDQILARILVPPSVDALHYGALRESIADAVLLAETGLSERGWDSYGYAVDDGAGSSALVSFRESICVGLVCATDPWRPFQLDETIAAAPSEVRAALARLRDAPMLAGNSGSRVTAMFWSSGPGITSGEPWPVVFTFGGEVLRREHLADDDWILEAGEYYELEPHQLTGSIETARRALESQTCSDSACCDGFKQLIREDAPSREEALAAFAAMRTYASRTAGGGG
jgi:hypothetical protein